MWKYIITRIIQIIVTMGIFLSLLYFIMDAQPGDITLQYMNNPKFSAEQREALKARLGLDQPVLVRFGKWMGNTLTGNLGISYIYSPRTVMEVMLERAPRTVFLFLIATMIEFFVGYWLGKVLAWQRGTGVEYGVTVVGAILYTVFTPWFALMMIWLFGFTLKWVPIGKFLDPLVWINASVNANYVFNRLLLTVTFFTLVIVAVFFLTQKWNPVKANRIRWQVGIVSAVACFVIWRFSPIGYLAGDIFKHMVLPIFVLVVINFSGTMLLTRTTMLETLREDYIMAARAKGLPERVVRDRHAARNALLPVFTSLIISLPFILGGGIITETVFSWPGMGLTLLEASLAGDIPLVMGSSMFIGFLALLAHLVSDVAYAFLDPRIRYS